jgi:hypothetical protein
MTISDVLFIALFLGAIGTLAVAVVFAFRGQRTAVWSILKKLAFFTLAYIATVYAVTASSKRRIPRVPHYPTRAGGKGCLPGEFSVETL